MQIASTYAVSRRTQHRLRASRRFLIKHQLKRAPSPSESGVEAAVFRCSDISPPTPPGLGIGGTAASSLINRLQEKERQSIATATTYYL